MKIYITTNWHQLRNKVLPTIPNRKNDKGIESLSAENSVLYFCDETKKFKKDKIEGCDLILIFDEKYSDAIKATTITSADYLLHHTRPAALDYSIFANKTDGKHEPHDNKYPAVFKIIFDDENNKAERIKKLLFKEVEVTINGITENKDVQDEYRSLYKQLTLDYINSKNFKTPNEVSDTVKNHLSAVKKYFEQENLGFKSELESLISITDVKAFYEQLVAIHTQVDLALFKISHTQITKA